MGEKNYTVFEWEEVADACNSFLKTHGVNRENAVKEIYENNLPRAIMDCMVIAYDRNIQAFNHNLGIVLNQEMNMVLNAYRQLGDVGFVGTQQN